MHTHARSRGRRLQVVSCVVVAGGSFAALVAACSSSSSQPPQLGGPSTDAAVDHTHEAAVEAAPPDTGPDVVEAAVEAEAGCTAVGDGGAAVAPLSLSFGDGGLVGCGTQALPVSVTLTNDTCEAFTFTAALTSGTTYYSVTPTTGTVQPGTPQTIEVSPNPIPSTSVVTPDFYQGTLSITTSAPGDSSHIVQLHQTAYGAIVTSTDFGQTLSLGSVAIGKTGSTQMSIQNGGNAPAPLSFSVGSPYFTVTTPDGGAPSFVVMNSQPESLQVSFSPIAVQPYDDSLTTTVAAGTPLCGPPPPSTPLQGSGTTGVAVSPGKLDFGLVQCGQPAAAYQNVSITNTGAAITYTPTFTLGGNSPYTLADDNGNPLTPGVAVVLGAASSTMVRVVPKQIPTPATTVANGYGDTLTITTTGAGDSPHAIPLTETAQGTLFTLSPAAITASASPGQTVFENFSVGNNGNLSAGYTLTANTTQGTPNTFTSNLTSGTLGPGASENGVLSCIGPAAVDGGATVQYLGTLTLTPDLGTVLCADPPPPMPLSIQN